MIDLMPFCLRESFLGRDLLKRPFSQGEWTYAVNGHVLVRVPRRDDVPESDGINLRRVYNHAGEKPADMLPLSINLPALSLAKCPNCNGCGFKHECPDCKCECETCDGTGNTQEKISIAIRDAIFDAKYIRLIQALPGARFAPTPSQDGPTWFSFDGGDGLIMPMRRPFEHHIEEAEGKV